MELELVRLADSLPVGLARPVGGPLQEHPMSPRPAGGLQIGDAVELYRGPKYTSRGTVQATSVEREITGVKRGRETREDLLETTNIAAAGDSGAPVLDSEGRVVGMLYAGSRDSSIVIPIEQIMAAFPEAF